MLQRSIPAAELSQEQAARLRSAVERAYSAAAERPRDKHAFPVGRAFAESVGYPAELLADLPAEAVEAFAGVSNVSLFAPIPPASFVLDLGCGAGLDSLIAARRAGPAGRVVGIDFSLPMLGLARRAAAASGLPVEYLEAEGERLPLGGACVDVALVNGIFNLNPGREEIFRELARVVRPGGAVYAAELIVNGPAERTRPINDSDWFA
jgi:SAM-dependent methyltransferase